jgi:GNAT superfamily N-acetyltransferase
VGCLLILSEWSDWRNGEVWWIHSLYFVPEVRGKGFFTEFYRWIEALARAQGVRGLRLYVDRNNRSAQQVYEHLGMSAEHYLLYERLF